MRFRSFLETAIGSKAKLKTLLFLLRENLPTSEREIAKSIGVSHMSLNRIMREFHDIHLVSPTRIGNVNVWKLNEKSYAYSKLKDLKTLAESPLDALKSDIDTTFRALNVKKAIIFGSLAEGTEQPDSDIDLFIMVENDQKKKYVLRELPNLEEKCMLKYGNRLSSHVLTDAESKKQTHLLEMAGKGIKVIG